MVKTREYLEERKKLIKEQRELLIVKKRTLKKLRQIDRELYGLDNLLVNGIVEIR